MTNRRKLTWGWWVALGFLAVVALVFGIGFAVAVSQRAAPAPAPSSSSTETAPDLQAASGCAVPAGDFTDVPGDLRWEATGGVTWPVSDSLGPVATRDGWAVCFSRSPVGAALAAVTSQFASVDHGTVPSMQFYVIDSPGKDVALRKAGSLRSLPDQLQQYGMQLAGFRVDEYTEDRALVRLVFAMPNSETGFRALPFPMEWIDGDWRVKLQDTGATGQAVDVNVGQFTRWTGNG